MSAPTDTDRRRDDEATAPGPILRPVTTRLVRPEWATRVVSPAYDSVRSDERRALMERDPYVFLHVTRSPGDGVPAGETETADEANEANAAALERLLAADVFGPVRPAGLYAYRLATGDHVQVAVIGDVDLTGLDDGRIGPHERIQPHRATLLADHVERLAIHSSPVAFGYPDDPVVDAVVAAATETEPLLDFERGDGLRQTIWAIPDDGAATIVDRLADERLYIVDGHHRVSAGVERWLRTGRRHEAAYVLGALFPAGQLRVSAFHRRVPDLGGHSPDELVAAIAAEGFTVTPVDADDDPTPAKPGEFGMYVAGRWFRIASPRGDAIDHTMAGWSADELDAAVLQSRILGPVLGVDEASAGGRLEYLPGERGLDQLVQLTDTHGGVAFALRPVTLGQLMAVVDRGETMPPKSTYFDPKVRSGVFLTPR